jgi:hypothetical protein
LGNAFPFPFLFSLRTILTIIVGMLALSVHAQEIYTGAIAISPSQRTNSWRPTNTLAPGDSAKLSITVAQSGSYNGRNYTLHGNPIQHPPISSPPGSIIWRGNYSSLHACNAGNSPGTTTATVTAEWVETGGGGGGGSGGSPSIIYGEATGIAQADIPVFSWSFDRRMQYADGTSPITYTVTGSITGRRVTMTSYTIKALVPEWTVTPDPLSSTNIRTGKITSTNSATSKMGVYYGERELGRSTNEIAFGKVDLIVSQGPGTNGGPPLPEDRLTNGGTAPEPNELTPGTIVLLLPQDQTNKVATTLTLKADPTGGSVTLDQHGLTDLKIYNDGVLQEELTLPKTWTNGDTPPSTLYMVGSSSSTNLQSAQGTLDFTYKATLADDGVEQSIKDTVGVNLLPVQIITINTFIPQNHIDNPLNGSRVFEGDDRINPTTGNAEWNKDGSYRTQERFNVIPFRNMGDADGLEDNAYANEPDGIKNDPWFIGIGTTHEYDKASSITAGKITAAAKADATLGDSYLKTREATASRSNMKIEPAWLGDRKIKVHCVGKASNPLASFLGIPAPAIDYDFNLTIDYTNAIDLRYSLEGDHDGFPAYEVYIGNNRVYEHDPIAAGQTPVSLGPPMEFSVPSTKINQPIP